MSLSIAYESVADAQMRLQNTVVLYDGAPVYIREVGNVGVEDPKGDIFRVWTNSIPLDRTKKADRKFISSRKFDLAPFPMGFMNKDGEALYCSRAPRKQQKQGLSDNTFSCVRVDDEMKVYALRDVISMEEFANCIKGQYPSFEQAVKAVEDGASSVAFSRSFAVVRDKDLPELVYLYHKKEKVGFIMNNVLKLSKKGRCLKESLNEAGVRC